MARLIKFHQTPQSTPLRRVYEVSVEGLLIGKVHSEVRFGTPRWSYQPVIGESTHHMFASRASAAAALIADHATTSTTISIRWEYEGNEFTASVTREELPEKIISLIDGDATNIRANKN